MALLANTVRDPKSRAQSYTPADFLIKWGPAKPQSWQDMKLIAKALTAQYGGTTPTD